MSIIAYVSGHGLGHSTREIEILRRLPVEIPLIVKTSAPEWFWRAEMRRPFDCVSTAFDVGCIQQNGLDIDVPATLRAWREVDAQNRKRFDAECDYLRNSKATLVVTDVASFPLTVAAEAGIPSICVANFTWADIYRPFIPEEPDFAPVVEQLEAEYARTGLHLEAGFSLPMPCFAHTESIGLVARQGMARREELLPLLPAEAARKRLALVYVGGWGLPIEYARVEAFPDWHFISLDPPPVLPANWSVLSHTVMAHPDLVASVDAVVSKPGYGIGAECVSAGTPLVYPPRNAFAEYAPMHTTLSQWPGGLNIPLDEFLAVDWGRWLAAVPPRGTVPGLPADGGKKAAAILTRIYNENRVYSG